MITITITIDGEDTKSRATGDPDAPEIERKIAAIVLAATDTVLASMEEDGENLQDMVAKVCHPTLKQRLIEAGLEPQPKP